MFKVKVSGIRELEQNMKAVIKDMERDLEGGTQEAAEYAASVVRSNAPVGETGRTKEAVTTKQLPKRHNQPANTMVGLDYNIAPHQHIVEFGSVRSRANPFFRQSINQARAGMRQRIQEHGSRSVKGRRG